VPASYTFIYQLIYLCNLPRREVPVNGWIIGVYVFFTAKAGDYATTADNLVRTADNLSLTADRIKLTLFIMV